MNLKFCSQIKRAIKIITSTTINFPQSPKAEIKPIHKSIFYNA